MLDSLKARFIVIGILIVLSIWSLWPRQVTIRVRGADGRMRDTTQQRVPIKQGLDLRGGMHLGLEIDQSKGKVDNPGDAIDRALKVIRTRIDEFGGFDPVPARCRPVARRVPVFTRMPSSSILAARPRISSRSTGSTISRG